jgi:negative regulator of flagellin synthesis FlgM
MTNPVSNFGGPDRLAPSAAQKPAKSERRDGADKSDAGGKVRTRSDDAFEMSDLALQAKQEPEFDRAKVDAIKQALKDGQYPLDARRIAENFVAIERMIKG